MTPDAATRGRIASRAAFIVVLLLTLAFSLTPRPAAAQCTEDAAGMCERPIACNPPAGGKCVTVAIPQPLTGHKFECRCLASKPANVSTGGAHAACLQRCESERMQCERARSQPGRNLCAAQFARCERTCPGV